MTGNRALRTRAQAAGRLPAPVADVVLRADPKRHTAVVSKKPRVDQDLLHRRVQASLFLDPRYDSSRVQDPAQAFGVVVWRFDPLRRRCCSHRPKNRLCSVAGSAALADASSLGISLVRPEWQPVDDGNVNHTPSESPRPSRCCRCARCWRWTPSGRLLPKPGQ